MRMRGVRVVWVLLAVVAIVACDKSKANDKVEPEPAPEQSAPAPEPAKSGPTFGAVASAAVSAAVDTKPAAAAPEPTPEPVAAAEPPPEPTPPEPVAVVEPTPDPTAPEPAPTAEPAVAATEPAAPAELKVGDKISAKWSDGYWYPAKISKVNANGTFDIKYDDGTKVKGQPKSKVKPRKPKAKSGGQSKSGGCSGGRTKCGGRCVDLQNDPNNCWSCGRQCPEACMGGSCVSNEYKYGN